ncbi:hypothetical protein P3T21_007811 [Paraburkholderia sp. GAS334]
MLSGPLYATYRQLLKAKCLRAGVELIRTGPVLYLNNRHGGNTHRGGSGARVLRRRA